MFQFVRKKIPAKISTFWQRKCLDQPT